MRIIEITVSDTFTLCRWRLKLNVDSSFYCFNFDHHIAYEIRVRLLSINIYYLFVM